MKRISLNLFFLLFLFSCKKEKKIQDYELAAAWGELTVHILKDTPSNTPTFASRSLGYIGLAGYESIAGNDSLYQSVASQLNGLNFVPNSMLKLSKQVAFNAAHAEILRLIFVHTSNENKSKIDSLEFLFYDYMESNIESKKYGKSVANSIFEWSKTDGGHRGYLNNFNKNFKREFKPGGWKAPLYAQSYSHQPLHPLWGKNRTFLKINSELNDPKFIAYNSKKGSEYFNQFVRVYEKGKNLTQAEKETALWWGDDPDLSPTPPGHSYYIANQIIKKKKPSLIVCALTYAKLGMSLSDAFRNCWMWKYKFYSERPNTFITEHIDNHWVSFWPDPPFPAFPSGHAIQAAAASEVFQSIYGDKFMLVDSLHANRLRDEDRNVDFKVRYFTKFEEIAIETANSRFFGGIHTPQDNNAGLIKGKEIAENFNNLNWKR
jgi:hypothetical protein